MKKKQNKTTRPFDPSKSSVVKAQDNTKLSGDDLIYQDNQLKFSQIFEDAPIGISFTSVTGKLLHVNKCFCDMLGYTMEEMTQSDFQSITYPDDLKSSIKWVKLAIAGKVNSNSFEKRYIHKNGNIIWVHITSSLLKSDEGNPLYFITYIQNITEHKKSETEIHASEILYRTIFETTSNATVIIDENTIITWANSETENLTGYSKNEMEGKKSWKEFVTLEDLERMVEMNIKRRAGDPNVLKNYDFKLKDRNGKIKNIHLTIDLIPGTKNSVASMLDITDRTKRELELKDSEFRYRSLVESFHDLVFLTDYSHRMIYSNPSLERQTGYIIQDFINDTENIRFVHPDDDEMVMKNIRKFIGSDDNFSKPFENRFIDKWKRLRWHSTVISKVIFKENPALQFICHDITNQKEYEEQLKHAKYKAEESDRLKSAFLANMSHEIRTPMNAILGFTGLLNDDSLSNEQKDEFVQIIQNSGQQLLALINDIIDISKIEAGQMRITKTLCRLNQIINDLYVSFNSDLILKNKSDVELIVSICKYCDGLNFITDEVRLKQVLANLLSNAVKFTHSGKIELGCSKNNDNFLLFYVADTGIGVPEDMYKLIFEPFRQVENTEANLYGGTGLGLSISKNLVELMGGEMWVEAGEKTGSVFYFTIPLIRNSDKSQTDQIESVDQEKYNWKHKTILITEDEISNFKYLQEILRKTEAEIIWAESGEQAIEICQNNPSVNLVLMDIRMLGMNGIEATKKIRKFRPDLPVVAQTAYAYSEDKEKCFNAGCVGFLTKPIISQKLFEVISNIFDNE